MVYDSYYLVSKFKNAFATLRALIRRLVNEFTTVIILLQKFNTSITRIRSASFVGKTLNSDF